MTPSLPPIASRALAILILLAGLGILYLTVLGPLLDDYSSTRDANDEMRAAITRYRRIGAELSTRRQMLAALRQQQAGADGFLPGTNEALVAAQIQNRLKALATAAHGELKSTQVLAAQDEGPYRRVTIRANMELDLAAAQRVIYGIESASPLLFLDNLDLRPRDANRGRDHTGAGNVLLELQFDAYGYMRGARP